MKLIWKTPVEAHVKGTYHKWFMVSWITLMVATGSVFVATAWFVVDRVVNDKHSHLFYLALLFLTALGIAHFVTWFPPKLYVSYKAKKITKFRSEFNDFLISKGLAPAVVNETQMLQLFKTGRIISGDWIIVIPKSEVGSVELLLTLRIEEPTDEGKQK